MSAKGLGWAAPASERHLAKPPSVEELEGALDV